jgi:hypothetical protein
MTTRALAVLALRVWGVVLLGWALATVPIILFTATLEARGVFGRDPARLPGLVVQFVAALALIVFAEPIARRAIPDDSLRDAGLDAAQLSIVAFALVGVFLLADGAQTAAAAGYALATKTRGPLRLGAFPVAEQLWERQRQQIARSIAEMLAGVAVLCRDRLARALAAARRARVGE